MNAAVVPTMTVEGELTAPVANARLVRFHFDTPVDRVMHESASYRLDMCLTPRPGNARGRYCGRPGTRHFAPLGNVFVVPPGENLQARCDGGCEQTSLLCEFDPAQMNRWLDTDIEWSDGGLLAGLDIRHGNIRLLLERLAAEARHPGFASATLTELVVAQLAVELARYQLALAQEGRSGGLPGWRLRLIDERLEEGGDLPTLGELAALCGLSVRQLTRGFRASRGCSIGDHMAGLRVAKARELLATDRSVKQIAYTLGFSSPSSFCYAFRRATGESPGRYRQRQRG